jgi:hypothetical protein
MRIMIGILSLLALLAAGCAGGGQEVGGTTSTGADGVELGSGDGTGPAQAGGDAATGGTAGTPAAPAAPTTDGGEAAPASGAAPAGVETVQAGEAGEVDVRIDGRRLELVEVREASGWTHTIDDVDDNEVDIDFRHDDGRLIELDIELEDDGRLEVDLR